jgi:hypothetical protein
MEFLVFPEVLKLVEGEVEGGDMEEEHNAESSKVFELRIVRVCL